MPMNGAGNGLSAKPVNGGSTSGPGTNAVRSGTLRAAPQSGNTMWQDPDGIVVGKRQHPGLVGDGMKSGDKVASNNGQHTTTGKSGGIVGSKPQGGGTSMIQDGLIAKPQSTSGDINSRDGVPAYSPLATPFGM